MMTCCELCGIGDDLDNMFYAKKLDKTNVCICEECSKQNGLSDIVSVKNIKKGLN